MVLHILATAFLQSSLHEKELYWEKIATLIHWT